MPRPGAAPASSPSRCSSSAHSADRAPQDGPASPRRRPRQAPFFERRLRRGIGPRLARTGALRGEAEAAHPLPAALLADGRPRAHSSRRPPCGRSTAHRPGPVRPAPAATAPAGPDPAAARRPGWCGAGHRWPPGPPPVAARDLADPVAPNTRCRAPPPRSAAPGQQPHDLPLAARHRIHRRPVPLLQFLDVKCGASVIRRAIPVAYTRSPYQRSRRGVAGTSRRVRAANYSGTGSESDWHHDHHLGDGLYL